MTPREAVALGWSVFPMQANKKPFFPWKKYQTSRASLSDLDLWEQEYHPSGWAAVTGSISGIVTLDFDGAAGRETMEHLDLNPHRRTPSGGYHVDFAHPGWPVPTVNSKSKIEMGKRWPGLDIRADGGYVLIYGKTDKGTYSWLREPEPEPLSKLPIELREFLGLLHPPNPTVITTKPTPALTNGHHDSPRVEAGKLLQDALAQMATNGRNNGGFWLATQLRDNGYSLAEAENLMYIYGSRCPDTNTKGQREPYTESEMLSTVRKAYESAPREPWSQKKVNGEFRSGAAAAQEIEDARPSDPAPDDPAERGDDIEQVKPDPLPEQPQPSKKKSKKSDQPANDEPKKESQATRLIRMISGVEFSHTPEGALFASFSVKNHRETHAIRSKAFRIYLQRRYHDETGSALGKNGISDALGVFEGRAVYDGPQKEVFCRIAQHGEAVYIDLGDPEWRAIEVTPEGWSVVSEYPVKFRRAKGMLELPVPIENDPDAERHFRECINVQTDEDFALVKAWVLGSLRPTGPYPVMWLKGPHGSAKTTTCKIFRQLLDPNQAAMRPLPKEERDFMIAASNSRLLALDNMSHLPDWASDSLCRITTGAGFATREMYSDTEETLFNVMCPVIINGIDEVMTRGDLIDRTVVVELAQIPEDDRLPETEFWPRFEQYRPGILGYFLNALQAAMSNIGSVKLDRLPRMADFALFVTAAEEALGWEPGYFLEIYDRNRAEANSIVLDASPVAQKLRTFLDQLTDDTYQRIYQLEGKWETEEGNSDVSTWTGPAASLLRNLNKLLNDEERRQKSWPKDARSLSVALRRLVANLKADGLIVHFCRESKARDIQISRASSVSHTT
jgi:hypothetical protein